MHYIDLFILFVYLLLCFCFVFFKSSNIKTLEDYTLGGRNFSTITLAATLFATATTASNTIGNTEKVYEQGLLYALPSLLAPIVWILTLFISLRSINKFTSCISINDIMHKLYGPFARDLTIFCSIIMAVGLLSVQATAIGYLFDFFLGIPYIYSIIIGFGCLTLYSIFGGVRAVALTDLMQFCVFFVIFPVVCFTALNKAGGYHAVLEKLPKGHLNIFENKDNILLFSCYVFYKLTPATAAPYIQRILMSKNKRQLIHTFIIVVLLVLVFKFVLIMSGLVVRAYAPNLNPKLSFYYFIKEHLPTGLVGLMVTGILAVIMSTADSWLNTSSSMVSRNIILRIYPQLSDKQELIVARLSAVIISIFAIFVSLKFKEIKNMIFFIMNFWEPLILVPFTAGFLGFRANFNSFIFSVVFGLLGTSIGWYVNGDLSMVSMTFGVIGSLIGFFGSHYVQKQIYK